MRRPVSCQAGGSKLKTTRVLHCPDGAGPTVWNSQLLRYAGFRQDDMSILGDPSEVQFTELVQRKFGWRPPGARLLQHHAGHLLDLSRGHMPISAPRMLALYACMSMCMYI